MDRLAELKLRLDQNGVPFGHGFWQNHTSTVDLEQFRGPNHYLAQNTMLETYQKSLERIQANDPWNLLQHLTEDDAFGCITFTIDGKVVSRDLLDSIEELGFLREHLGWQQDQAVRILDVGAGYGRLAHRILAAMPNAEVWCTDAIAESTWVCEKYLAYRHVTERVRVIAGDQLQQELTGVAFDVAVAVHSWSECTDDAVRWWLNLLHTQQVPAILCVFGNGVWNEERFTPIFRASGYDLAVYKSGDLDQVNFCWYLAK